MRVPKILYHGTNVYRWAVIRNDGSLRPDMSKRFDPVTGDDYLSWKKGYVYLTTDVNNAINYGLQKSLWDIKYSDIPENTTSSLNYKDPVVIGVKTSNLRDNIEIDPEVNTSLFKHWFDEKENFHWYRYKGDIKLAHLFLYKHYPFDALNNQIKKKTKWGEMIEKLRSADPGERLAALEAACENDNDYEEFKRIIETVDQMQNLKIQNKLNEKINEK